MPSGEVAGWSEERCYEVFKRVRFAETDGVPQCPYCDEKNAYECVTPYRSRAGAGGARKRGRDFEAPLLRRFFKCRRPTCRRTFTVTSGTTWDSHKLPVRDILLALAYFQQARLGASALELTRVIGCTYPVALVLEHKIREAIREAQGEGLLRGDVSVDGTFVNAKPRWLNIKANMYTPEWRAYARETHDRELTIITVRQTWPVRITKTRIMREEDAEAAAWVASLLSPKVRSITSDEAKAWGTITRTLGIEKERHRTVKHALHYVGPNGANIAANEAFHWLTKTGVKGVYVGGGLRYTQAYLDEFAWRMDHVRVTPAEQIAILLHATLTTPRSRLVNYWQRGRRAGQRAKAPRPDYRSLSASRRNLEVYRRPDRHIVLSDVVATLRGSREAADRHRRQVEAVAAARRLGGQALLSAVAAAPRAEPLPARRPRVRRGRADDDPA